MTSDPIREVWERYRGQLHADALSGIVPVALTDCWRAIEAEMERREKAEREAREQRERNFVGYFERIRQ